MPEQARVTSLDALESFRASLILYVGKARPTLEEITSDVVRTRLWLESDQRTHWLGELRRRTKKLEEAQENLYRANLASLRKPTTADQMAVRKAREAVEEAGDKLKRIKKWVRDFDSEVEPIARQLEKLHTVLANVLPRAVAHLGNTITTLQVYAETGRSAPVTDAAAAPAALTQEAHASDNPAEPENQAGGLKP